MLLILTVDRNFLKRLNAVKNAFSYMDEERWLKIYDSSYFKASYEGVKIQEKNIGECC